MKIQITIDRFEGDQAVLKTETGDTIIWPQKHLPKNAKESSVMHFFITNDLQEEDEKKEMAKAVLNELLRVEEDEKKT